MSFDSLEKTRARHAAKIIRAKLAGENPSADARLIGGWPTQKFQNPKYTTEGSRENIGCYLPIHSEISPLPLMEALADAGYQLALPCIKRKAQPLEFRAYAIGDKLRGGAFGTKEPLRDVPIVEPDILLVPLLAYSRNGMRMGYGGGFYDRTLAQLRLKKRIFACGLGYSGQQVGTLPIDKHDQVLDGVLTEIGFTEFPKC